jgi:hypothetical protein
MVGMKTLSLTMQHSRESVLKTSDDFLNLVGGGVSVMTKKGFHYFEFEIF